MSLSHARRKTFQLSILLLLTLTFAAGCGGDGDEVSPPMPGVGGGGETPAPGGGDETPEPGQAMGERLISTAPYRLYNSFYRMSPKRGPQKVNGSLTISSGHLGHNGQDAANVTLSSEGVLAVNVNRPFASAGEFDDPYEVNLGAPATERLVDGHKLLSWDSYEEFVGLPPENLPKRRRVVARGWQSAEDYGDWGVIGFYLFDEGTFVTIGVGAFTASPEFRTTPVLPESGTASYQGRAFGAVAQEYGTDRQHPSGTIVEGMYEGKVSLDVRWGPEEPKESAVTARIYDLSTVGEGALTLPDGSQLTLPEGSGLGLDDLGLGEMPRDGMESGDKRLWLYYSSIPDADGNPRRVAGIHRLFYRSSGDTRTILVGAHEAVTEASGLMEVVAGN